MGEADHDDDDAAEVTESYESTDSESMVPLSEIRGDEMHLVII